MKISLILLFLFTYLTADNVIFENYKLRNVKIINTSGNELTIETTDGTKLSIPKEKIIQIERQKVTKDEKTKFLDNKDFDYGLGGLQAFLKNNQILNKMKKSPKYKMRFKTKNIPSIIIMSSLSFHFWDLYSDARKLYNTAKNNKLPTKDIKRKKTKYLFLSLASTAATVGEVYLSFEYKKIKIMPNGSGLTLAVKF